MRGKRLDISGKKFGRLTAISISKIVANKTSWLCKCDCGSEKSVLIGNLRNGATQSCGCLQKERAGLKPSPLKERFENLVLKVPMTDCHYFLGTVGKHGYGTFTVKTGVCAKAHRFAYLIYKGDFKGHVLHNCDNRLCVNPDHLRVGTNQENMTDKSIRGKFRATPEIVHEIRNYLDQGYTQLSIGQMFGLSRTYIGKIKLQTRRQLV